MAQELKQTYKGITIAYEEYENKWVFELRGKERSVDSLKTAKEEIDKPPPKEKKPFMKVEVWRDGFGYSRGDGFVKVVVSSIADAEARHGYVAAWLTYNKERRKEDISGLFLVNAHNDAIVQAIATKRGEIEAAQEAVVAMIGKLKPFEIPKNTE